MTMRIVSGIQPTGSLHLGNYLGAIRNWVRMQDATGETGGECYFFLADLHALSSFIDPAVLAAGIREMAAALIAAGIDPARATLFRQSKVTGHAELQWLLNGTARVGWLNRMTQFKDKSGKNREGASVRLVEQNANAALKHSHRAYVLETGTVTISGPSSEIATDPRVKEAYLGE